MALQGSHVAALSVKIRCVNRSIDLLKDIEDLFPNARENIAQAGLMYGTDKAKRK